MANCVWMCIRVVCCGCFRLKSCRGASSWKKQQRWCLRCVALLCMHPQTNISWRQKQNAKYKPMNLWLCFCSDTIIYVTSLGIWVKGHRWRVCSMPHRIRCLSSGVFSWRSFVFRLVSVAVRTCTPSVNHKKKRCGEAVGSNRRRRRGFKTKSEEVKHLERAVWAGAGFLSHLLCKSTATWVESFAVTRLQPAADSIQWLRLFQ